MSSSAVFTTKWGFCDSQTQMFHVHSFVDFKLLNMSLTSKAPIKALHCDGAGISHFPTALYHREGRRLEGDETCSLI